METHTQIKIPTLVAHNATRMGHPRGLFLIESVPCWHAAVFLQPLQFFPHFDFAVPGIFA